MAQLLKAEQAFNMKEMQDLYEKTTPKSFQAILIDAPRMTNPKNPKVEKQMCINVEFRPLSSESNAYRAAGTKSRLVTLFERTNKAAYMMAVELYEQIAKIPAENLLARRQTAMKFIQDEVKSFNTTSFVEYVVTDKNDEPQIDLLTGLPIVTKNHTFFLFADDSLVRAVTSKVRSIDTWKEGQEINETIDADTKSDVDEEVEASEAKIADELGITDKNAVKK